VRKDESIETLRAIAITLVVSLHLTHDAPLAPARDFYEFLSYTFQNLRLPLFTVISGYIYATRPVVSGKYGEFVQGKLRRVFLPLVCVSTIEFLITALAPGIHNPQAITSIWRIYILPYETYWFLQSIFLVFLLVGLIESRGRITTPKNWLIAVAISVVLHFGYPAIKIKPDFFSLGSVSYLLPFFLVGLGIQRFPSHMMSKRSVLAAGTIFAASFVLQQLNWFRGGEFINSSKGSLLGLAVGTSACLILFKVRRGNRALAWVGSYAYTIYLFESFGAGVGRRLLNIPGINPHLYFVGVLALTLSVGIAIENTVGRIPYVRTFLLGKHWPTLPSSSKVAAGA